MPTPSPIWRYGIPFELGLGVVACILGWAFGVPPWSNLHWSNHDLLWGVLATAPMFAVFAFSLRSSIPAMQRIRQTLFEFLGEFARGATWQELAAVSLAAGLGEELMFRGWIQASFTNWWGLRAGLLAASVVFGLLHAVTLAYAVLATAIGLYLGLLWWGTGNLLAPVVAHAVYDWIALMWLVRRLPGMALS